MGKVNGSSSAQKKCDSHIGNDQSDSCLVDRLKIGIFNSNGEISLAALANLSDKV